MEDTVSDKYIPITSIRSGVTDEVIADLCCCTIQIVNVVLAGTREEWVLIDTGMPHAAEQIVEVAEQRFGTGAKPKAIILTHGHFDHAGSVIKLVEAWDVPIYAHELELPYLTGKSSYPEPDDSVEGGLVAKLSSLFPNEPIDLSSHVHALPPDGTVPGMRGWRWIHTPGHTPGHISLFRDSDRSLIAGDAFVTVEQDSLYKVITQKKQLSGPPVYFTTDWQAAWESVKKLKQLDPALVITGHGVPMLDDELTDGLTALADDFERIAIPEYGHYVRDVH